MTRFLSLLALTLALLGAVSQTAFAGPGKGGFETCQIDDGYGRTSSCNVSGG